MLLDAARPVFSAARSHAAGGYVLAWLRIQLLHLAPEPASGTGPRFWQVATTHPSHGCRNHLRVLECGRFVRLPCAACALCCQKAAGPTAGERQENGANERTSIITLNCGATRFIGQARSVKISEFVSQALPTPPISSVTPDIVSCIFIAPPLDGLRRIIFALSSTLYHVNPSIGLKMRLKVPITQCLKRLAILFFVSLIAFSL